jgi:hypothetical protein
MDGCSSAGYSELRQELHDPDFQIGAQDCVISLLLTTLSSNSRLGIFSASWRLYGEEGVLLVL